MNMVPMGLENQETLWRSLHHPSNTSPLGIHWSIGSETDDLRIARKQQLEQLRRFLESKKETFKVQLVCVLVYLDVPRS